MLAKNPAKRWTTADALEHATTVAHAMNMPLPDEPEQIRLPIGSQWGTTNPPERTRGRSLRVCARMPAHRHPSFCVWVFARTCVCVCVECLEEGRGGSERLAICWRADASCREGTAWSLVSGRHVSCLEHARLDVSLPATSARATT